MKPEARSQLAVTIPWELRQRVRVQAVEDGVTVGEWVTDALRAHMERVEQAQFARVMARGVRSRLVRERLRAMLGSV